MKNVMARLDAYERLMRLDKPIGILLLLWPTLWALWISSNGHPDWLIVWIFMLGTVLMRSAGCVMNDYADRKFDAHVERTRSRPLATGEVSPREALVLAGVLSLLAFGLVLLLNKLTVLLSVCALFLAMTYPYTKRFISIPQAYLGVAFGFGIPMAFAAHNGTIPPLAWALLAANIFWAVAYDTEYAMVDRDDDIKIGIRSSALFFGRYDIAAVMACYVVMLGILAWVGMEVRLHWPYYVGLAMASVIALYHYTLIRARERGACFKAFLHNNWLGAVIFAGLFASYRLA
ncbi:4-hydroxybenzoate polyprenyltransferase [Methylobacillus sp. MM3]|jgi:4-hydroxybenzoate polyprenyltransferase|uniref:4-hydroxybenzoate octaprenyltransferase n=1 Tax=Methylobacillus sp. MM3 TaxID=1848039 RepID=UPI0007E1D8D5|nr:4-hydroxybenzoate octaprenyltransferase [Methylobacillus sp. MM3]OAJ70460.1 4-hydroxybenzoate polyprenyltransferase [Methylobacillus sp. MM3]